MSTTRLLTYAGPVVIVALGAMNIASAQSSSPFAKKNKTQAWDTTPAPAPVPQPRPAPAPTPTYAPPAQTAPQPAPSAYPVQNIPSQSYTPGSHGYTQGAPAQPPYTPPAAPVQDLSQIYPSAAPQTAPAAAPTPATGGAYYPGRPNGGQGYPAPAPQSAPQYGQAPYAAPAPGTAYPTPAGPRTWKQKFGLDRITTLFRGGARVGAAASYRDVPPNQPIRTTGPEDGFGEDFIADADIEFEASTITDGGLEYGVNLGLRGQYDPYRRGFGGRISDCPPTVAGCAASINDTVVSGLRGHTSQFYQIGNDTAKDAQIALESAHLFLRSAYGDVTIGWDDGAAYLFSLGAPTLLAVNASNSPVDYTGLDSVKTINDASGFSEKITYTSPRLLGDQIGVGVQFGVSYALDADACGVDYCNDRSIAGVIRPDLEDVVEAGLALDRTFANGISVEGTATYARASETSGLNGLDDLAAYGLGLELGYADWTMGGSWLQSNNGLEDGDYSAYDVGVTWKPGKLGFSLAYGHATDDNVGLESDQGTFGITYDFDKFTLGTGVQYVDRTTNAALQDLLFVPVDEQGTSLFIEGGFKF